MNPVFRVEIVEPTKVDDFNVTPRRAKVYEASQPSIFSEVYLTDTNAVSFVNRVEGLIHVVGVVITFNTSRYLITMEIHQNYPHLNRFYYRPLNIEEKLQDVRNLLNTSISDHTGNTHDLINTALGIVSSLSENPHYENEGKYYTVLPAESKPLTVLNHEG